jgi:hypothetical protein
MAYDRADWHYGGNYPSDLPPENGGTHIGMFLAWAAGAGLIGELHVQESADELRKLREREITGCQFLFTVCDEKFWEEDLNAEGNAFAQDYYASDEYFDDYSKILGDRCETLYHVEDSWENFDRLRPLLDQRLDNWRKRRNRKWWQVWR